MKHFLEIVKDWYLLERSEKMIVANYKIYKNLYYLFSLIFKEVRGKTIFNLFKIDCHNNDRDDNAIAVGGPSSTRIIQRAHTHAVMVVGRFQWHFRLADAIRMEHVDDELWNAYDCSIKTVAQE